MSSPAPSAAGAFSHTRLPVVNKDVFRMGIAGTYGIDSADIEWAAGEGVNYWVWGRGFGRVTEGIRHTIAGDRERHVVAMLGWGYFGWQVRRSVEAARRILRTDYLDVFKLGGSGAHRPATEASSIRSSS